MRPLMSSSRATPRRLQRRARAGSRQQAALASGSADDVVAAGAGDAEDRLPVPPRSKAAGLRRRPQIVLRELLQSDRRSHRNPPRNRRPEPHQPAVARAAPAVVVEAAEAPVGDGPAADSVAASARST